MSDTQSPGEDKPGIETPFICTLTASLALIVVADDEVEESELATNSMVLRSVLGEALHAPAVELAANLIKRTEDELLDIIRRNRDAVNFDERAKVLNACALIAAMGRTERVEEISSIKMVAGALGFERSQADQFVSRMVKRMRR